MHAHYVVAQACLSSFVLCGGICRSVLSKPIILLFRYVNEILGAVPANISEVILRKDGSYFVAQATAGAVDVKIEDETPFVAEDLPPLKAC